MSGAVVSSERQERFLGARRAGERVDDLQHKGRFLLQREAAFYFSLDAVLLAHFAALKNGDHILDLGTGSGVLPILLADEGRRLRFTAMELQHDMAELAARNVALNGLDEEIDIVEGDYRNIDMHCARESFDVVLANPPFFVVGEGRESPVPAIARARHEHTATLADTVEAACRAMKYGGRFYMIHRAARSEEIVARLAERQLAIKRLRFVHPFAEREADLVLIGARKGGKTGLRVDPPLIVRGRDGAYSEEIRRYYGGENL